MAGALEQLDFAAVPPKAQHETINTEIDEDSDEVFENKHEAREIVEVTRAEPKRRTKVIELESICVLEEFKSTIEEKESKQMKDELTEAILNETES